MLVTGQKWSSKINNNTILFICFHVLKFPSSGAWAVPGRCIPPLDADAWQNPGLAWTSIHVSQCWWQWSSSTSTSSSSSESGSYISEVPQAKMSWTRSLAGDASGNPGDGGKPLATAGDCCVASRNKLLLPKAFEAQLAFDQLPWSSAVHKSHIACPLMMNQAKKVGRWRCVGCWKLQHQELLVIDPAQITRLGACIMRWDATNDFALAGDASGNPGDGGNPGELIAAFHRQSMKKQYIWEHEAACRFVRTRSYKHM